MASFSYNGTDGRDFPAEPGETPFDQSFTVEPGAQITADVNPDPNWFDAPGTQTAAVTTQGE